MGPLIPIEYSADEIAAVAAPAAADAAAADAAAAPAGPPGASIKELIAAIPTRRDALYESAVDWEAAEAAGVLESKIRPWLAKKIAEYLGEEEPTLVEFVMTKLAERLPPAKIEAEMVQVLDDDAEMFVVKLWRLLLFEVLRAGAEC